MEIRDRETHRETGGRGYGHGNEKRQVEAGKRDRCRDKTKR